MNSSSDMAILKQKLYPGTTISNLVVLALSIKQYLLRYVAYIANEVYHLTTYLYQDSSFRMDKKYKQYVIKKSLTLNNQPRNMLFVGFLFFNVLFLVDCFLVNYLIEYFLYIFSKLYLAYW